MRIALAIGVSLTVHLILAVALAWYFTFVPDPVVLAKLDLSSVELSLAEEDTVEAVPVASLPSAPSSEARKREKTPDEKAPEPEKVEETIPDLAEPAMPEVKGEVPILPTVKAVSQDADRSPRQQALPQQAPRQAKVDAPPSLKRAIRPDYPIGARRRKEQGDVQLEIRVSETGEVEDVKVVAGSGYPELDAAAVKATKAARFRPAQSGREAVSSVARLTVNFKLK